MRAAVIMLACTLAACSGEPDLLTLTSDGPDEFSVLPGRALEAPPDFNTLPPPGGSNRAGVDPRADAIAALGGNARARQAGGVPASESALVARVVRYGTAQDIRERLAAEDLEFRRRNDARPLERLFGTNIYYRAYRSQSLDQYAELERFRRLGIRTVAAPPDPAR